MLPLLRFTLDLFATDPLPEPTPPVPKTRRKPGAPITPTSSPVRPTSPQAPAGERAAYVPGVPLPGAIAPASFAHPQANREVRLADAVVAYAFTRAKRKSIGFVIGPDGLVVRAPRWTPLYEVDAALQEKAGWILRKLQESRERQSRAHSARVEWRDGVSIPFLGESITVMLDPTHGFSGRGAQLKTRTTVDAASGAAVPDNKSLHVGLPKAATPDQIRDAVQAWLMRQAATHFKLRMEHFAPLLGVQWKKLRLSSAGTRWGSASADGSIRLNWRLIHLREPVIDYVVAHELSHLRVMDHSASFWNTVGTVVPDYQQLRTQLKEDAIPQW
ncbi:MAG: M48 family metallopeptidase [Rhodoferax sp.]|nr:M48 family metallopeptidase [Rhodoferax sp.]